MTKAEKLFAGEMTIRLSWFRGFQSCTWPAGDDKCYTLLWPDRILTADRDGEQVFVCPFHYQLWCKRQRMLLDAEAEHGTPQINTTIAELYHRSLQ